LKTISTIVLATFLISPALAQRVAVVRGIGTQSCKTYVASSHADKKLAQQADQWVFGSLTSYFRQARDDPSRTLSDAIVLQTVVDICKKNAEKTIDEAVTIAISSFPATEVKKPTEK
jgi:hypothetical protein